MTEKIEPAPISWVIGPAQTEDVRPNIYQRMNAVMQAVDYVQKTKPAGMRYSVVSHDAVTAKVRPEIVKAGIVYYPESLTLRQNGNRTEVEMVVRFQNIDDRDDYMDVFTAGYGIDESDKGVGKAISYAVKYALLKALGLESGDDPDEDQDTPHSRDDTPFVDRTEERIAGAHSSEALRPIDTDIKNAFQTGNIGEQTAAYLRGLIRQKVADLKKHRPTAP